jgi:hypothetical protein
MLSDPKSRALVENFAGQWLFLRNVQAIRPDPRTFPDFDENLRLAFKQETELFFESILRENRSALDLLTADYTFINERLARHYGIPNVYGDHFRRVQLKEPARGGLLGHGSILTVTSHANRTSPVSRGVWILENIIGVHPPEPPANVPDLPEPRVGELPATMRERMVQHRANPTCASCHSQMDPLGLAMESFDAVGRWRTQNENGSPLDVSGALPDGTGFDGPLGLREVLVRSYSTEFVKTVTEKLLVYALGRGLEYYDMPTVRAIVRDASTQNYRLTSLVLGIITSAPFQMRRSADGARIDRTPAH